jgi:hypothetical protein
MKFPLAARSPIERLTDVQSFLQSAEHLKALTEQLQQRRNRRSRLESSLERQVLEWTNICKGLGEKNPTLAGMWREVIAELEALTQHPEE